MQLRTSLAKMARYLGIALLAVSVLSFASYSLRFGLRGMGIDLSEETYIYTPDGTFTNIAIFSHMILGAAAVVLVPMQLVGRVRVLHPWLHRMVGRVIVIASIAVAVGGLTYIALRGTIAGPLMDLGFALYGALMLGAAVQAQRLARAGKFERHRDWALRLFVLLMGSLTFRLHYVIWYSLTDGMWSNDQLTGIFDKIQYFAFYLPYLVALEIWLRRPARRWQREPLH
jgi:uncharacterized membrane protein